MRILIQAFLTIASATLIGCAGVPSPATPNASENVNSVAPDKAPASVSRLFSQAVVFAYRVTPTETAGEFDSDGGSTAIVLGPDVIQTARHAIHSPLNQPVDLYLVRRQTTGTVLASAEKSEPNGDWALLKLSSPVWGREEKVPALAFANLPVKKGGAVYLLGYIVQGDNDVVPAIIPGVADSDFAPNEPIRATIQSRLYLGGMSGGALAVERGSELVVVGSIRSATDPNHPQKPRVICSRLSPATLQAAQR
ncbi:MAG: trypsin-like peptidase domain-containing protein [Phycisphaerales bacterium]